jgi:N-methylhydantoinase B
VVPKGRRLLLKLPGGGGYGDPRERDAALVERDVADGLVSEAAARRLYGR